MLGDEEKQEAIEKEEISDKTIIEVYKVLDSEKDKEYEDSWFPLESTIEIFEIEGVLAEKKERIKVAVKSTDKDSCKSEKKMTYKLQQNVSLKEQKIPEMLWNWLVVWQDLLQ